MTIFNKIKLNEITTTNVITIQVISLFIRLKMCLIKRNYGSKYFSNSSIMTT